jgi:predicted Ser/Thr protein kinase
MAIQDALPDRLGPYRLLDRIGEGGMGVVHLAADPENRLVAIKILRPQIAADVTARRRLAREVETMRRVRSPFVAEVIDADVVGQVPYIVTRYVRGRTLEQVVEEGGPLRGPRLQRLACGLAAAISAVHAAGVVHRDLKPGNVMMVDDHPVVIDFGIAQAGEATTRLTQTGMFVGTPGYLAPEVIAGRPSGQSSDVHSWGATVAFASTGKPPFGTGTYEVVFFRILHGGPNLDGLPGPLYPLVAAALTREPARRPSAAWLAGQAARLDLSPQAASWQAASSAQAGDDDFDPVRNGAHGAPVGGSVSGAGGPVDAGPVGGVPTIGPSLAGAPLAGAPPVRGPVVGGPVVGGPVVGGPLVGAAAPTRQVAGIGLPGAGPWAGSGPGAAVGHTETGHHPGSGAATAYGAPAASAYETPADVADLLPPVRYAPPPEAGRRRPPPEQDWAQPSAGAARRGRAPSAPHRHRMLALAALVTAVGLSVILPVAGTVLALASIALLRGGDRAQNGLAVRRSVRGPRATDALVIALSAPWTLARSILVTLLVAPLGLFVAGVAAVAAIIAAHGTQLPVVGAYAAGLFMALSCLGPGSRAPRRQLNRVFNAIAPTRLARVAATIILGSLAAALVSLAMIKVPVYWPVGDPLGLLTRLPGAGVFGGTLHHLRHAGHGLTGRVHVP